MTKLKFTCSKEDIIPRVPAEILRLVDYRRDNLEHFIKDTPRVEAWRNFRDHAFNFCCERVCKSNGYSFDRVNKTALLPEKKNKFKVVGKFNFLKVEDNSVYITLKLYDVHYPLEVEVEFN